MQLELGFNGQRACQEKTKQSQISTCCHGNQPCLEKWMQDVSYPSFQDVPYLSDSEEFSEKPLIYL